MSLYECILKLYEEFYRQVSLKGHYVFYPSTNDKKLTCKFIRWIKNNKKSHANSSFLISYFEFQFSHYSGIETKYGKNQILFNWLIGPKAIERFEKRNVSKRWLVRLKMREEVDLNLNKAFKNFGKPKTTYVNKLYDYEENDKKRFYNKPQGFIFCLTTTTLFNPISQICLNCNNKIDCKKALQANINKLYILRGL